MKSLLRKIFGAPLATMGWLVLVSWFAVGCQVTGNEGISFTSVAGEEAMTGMATGDSPRISKGDMVKVTFSGTEKEIKPHEERVKEDGTITLPLINVVKAEGKTTGDLQKEIHDRYVPDYYTRLTVTVSTDQQLFYVQGQVRTPGKQLYVGHATVLKAIAGAGDFTDFADRKRVRLTRADGSYVIVNCILAAKDSTHDLLIFPGDKIEVPLRRPFFN